MIAYDKNYLTKAQNNLANMFDRAVHDYKYDLDKFYDLFAKSDSAKIYETGDCIQIANISGTEMAFKIAVMDKYNYKKAKNTLRIDRTPEYWFGWAIAYYQWARNISFKEIANKIKASDILKLYNPYHEMDIRNFVSAIDSYVLPKESKLKEKRKMLGISQSDLAKIADVPLRTIQQYEQKQKSINKASVETVIMLSRALGCNLVDILE